MLLSKNTSTGITKILFKAVIILIIIMGVVVMLSKIDFPSPNKTIEKIISNEKLKIVK